MLEKAGAPTVGECEFHFISLETEGTPMKLTDQEAIQAITDALGGLAIALGEQVDPARLAADLRRLADEAEQRGQGPSAGLLDEIARTVEARLPDRN
ncbi:hypothetical protein CCR84_12540 [Rhodocyclus purpureus]|nr:hypothetical protein [Rhodocyclus purpureus]